jgi:hypothetical protein
MNARAKWFCVAIAWASLGIASAQSAHAIVINAALGKPTTGDVAFGFPTSLAVDGNTANFTHSNNVGPVFWQVDLTAPTDLFLIELLNRAGCCPDRLNGAVLSVLDSAQNPIFTAPPIAAAGDGQTFSFNNGGAGFTGARYIRVNHTGQYLSIAELRAFSEILPQPVDNLAYFFGTATQSTTGFSLPASGAIDGNRIGNSISHTATGDLTPSLNVALNDLYRIQKVDIFTRDNCCTGPPNNSPERDYNLVVEVLDGDGNVVFTSDVLNPWDGVDPAGSAPVIGLGASFSVDMPGAYVTGKSVRVSKTALGGVNHSEWLSLAEVEIYGSTSPVPEPSSVCLIALGAVGVLLARRRK